MPTWKSFGSRGRARGRGRGGQPGRGTRPAKEHNQYKRQLLFAKSGADGPASKLCVRCSKRQNFHVTVQQPVLCPVVSPVPFVLNVRGQSQNKDGNPSLNLNTEINFVKSVFSVDHCVFAPTVPSAHNVANPQLVGGRLQKFWQTWSLLGANPRVVSILKDGYILPFKIRPPLVRDPLIVSGYANPLRNLYLREALQALLQKEAVEMVRFRTSLAFINRLFIVPKPNQKWRPILDLSALNKFLSIKTLKMETSETIRISLQ